MRVATASISGWSRLREERAGLSCAAEESHAGKNRSSGLSARSSNAFTMIEIAISLAVIGFALVAIIGILPFAMSVQRENREETIINQEANVFLSVIRNGVLGMDDLTNYVMVVTNSWARYNKATGAQIDSDVYWYTTTNSYTGGGGQYPLTNGMRIVGLLSTPKYIQDGFSQVRSNYVSATVRAMSGLASEKAPQDNADQRDLGLRYRLISEVVDYGAPVNGSFFTNNAAPRDLTNYAAYQTNTPQWLARAAYYNYSTNLSQHLRDIRLIFRWPVLPNGTVPSSGGRQVYCTSVTGDLKNVRDGNLSLYWLQPTLFTTNSL